MKLMVNLQVTAMLAIFEFSYGLLYIIIFANVTKGSSFATLIQAMALHFVLLPFSFLMNTTDNKYRIVEIGWKNVIKNIIHGWIDYVRRIFPKLQPNNRVSNAPAQINHDNITHEIQPQAEGLQENQEQKPKDSRSMDSLQETHKREPKDSKKKAHRNIAILLMNFLKN